VEDTTIEQTTTTTETPATTAPTVRVLNEELARTGSDTRTHLTLAGLALLLGGVAVMFGAPSAATARRDR
jgi:LPXTG-motif cell wall-anchored protein